LAVVPQASAAPLQKPASLSTSSLKRYAGRLDTKLRPRTRVRKWSAIDQRIAGDSFIEEWQLWTLCDLATLLDGRSEGHAHDRLAVLFE
jgi:hypothetical protein